MKPLIIANWKMNPTTMKEAKQLFDSISEGVKNIENTETVICPPFIYLPLLKGLTLGAQDCYWKEKGAYTGEISAAMLKEMGCKYVIVGHSERRKLFGEKDNDVNKKILTVLDVGLIPILCVGETEQEREQEKTEEVLKEELEMGLINVHDVSKVIIAYEPIWAIGTGNPCDIEEAQKMALLIRKIVSKNVYPVKSRKAGISLGAKLFNRVKILYGGSVNSKNAAGYIKEAGFQGLLVGGASLKAEEFIAILKAVN